ncbi:MAG TPA: methylated-DNA--[protein]-cysteine S-methyltransferase [Mycobacteriales bacterium]|nr:methylated-DNA--[protein]-cysteine S-methyltransferase [Mycobacteriales bacterium]
MTLHATTLRTPAGDLSLIARDDVLIAAGFAPIGELADRLPDERLEKFQDLGGLSAGVQGYLDGDLGAIDDLPTSQPGGAFAQAAWKVMRAVPPGETITYAELAGRAGSPNATRAAGSACARNLIAPIVPCHRVVRTGGGLGGYYYGLPTKRWLLAHERRCGLRRLEA